MRLNTTPSETSLKTNGETISLPAIPRPARLPGVSLGLHYRALRYRKYSNKAEVSFLKTRLKEGDCALDVGAYKGGLTYWMAQAVGPTGKVLAFEPQVRLAAKLGNEFEKVAQVEVHPFAASSSSETKLLRVPPRGKKASGASLEQQVGDDSWSYRLVSAVSLDDLTSTLKDPPKVSLIKVDVEGHELSVFKGAEHLLRRDYPTLLFECESRHRNNELLWPVFAYLRGLGYDTGHALTPTGDLMELGEFSESKHQVRGENPYLNMFVFDKFQS